MPGSTRNGWTFLLAISSALLTGCGSEPVPTPKKFLMYNSSDGAFQIEYPEEWEATSNVGKRMSWANFELGGAKISVRADAKASLLDDAGGGRSADRNAPVPELAPVHGIHEMGLDGAPDEYGSYQEVAPGTQVLDCKLGPARYSEFTGTSGLSGKVHGYRATAIGHKLGVHVICVCPESDWKRMKPGFGHVLATLKRGQQE